MPPVTTTNPPRWKLSRPDTALVDGLMRAHHVTRVTASMLVARGIGDPAAAGRHLEPKLSLLHDPALLPDMKAATARIARAIEKRETILVHGDYDVDGVTGTTLLMRLFSTLGANARWHIPNRFTDGYSFGPHSIEKVKETGAKLVISVDNGTSAFETIRDLAALGVDTIVTDHHEAPLGALPPAVAIVNPKLATSTYPFRELCGGAVAFKLAWGLCQEISGASRVREDLAQFLRDAMGYVAIATVCDVVPLVDENRILGCWGLRSLESTQNHGLRALLDVARIAGTRVLAEDVAFKVGPRINASGRLGSAQKAVELLLATDRESARRIATELDELNTERKRIEVELLKAAIVAAEPYADRDRHPVLVVAGEGWHQGVVGIIAARLATRYERPAIVIGHDGRSGRGSARSVAGFSVLDAMHGASGVFVKYGGHEQAAGCEVETHRIADVREAVCARAREMLGERGFVAPEVWIDHELPFAHMTPALMKELERLQPFGEKNEKPLLFSADLRLAEPARIVGEDRTHLMLKLRSGEHVLKAMMFGRAHRAGELSMGAPIHAVYTPKWNLFNGVTSLELELVDFRVGDRPAF
jgi:single-stranded-DNA-specific exonuclease